MRDAVVCSAFGAVSLVGSEALAAEIVTVVTQVVHGVAVESVWTHNEAISVVVEVHHSGDVLAVWAVSLVVVASETCWQTRQTQMADWLLVETSGAVVVAD